MVDALIIMERACQALGFSLSRVLTERDLKRDPVRVRVRSRSGNGEATRTTAVIPDAWVQIAATAPSPYCIAIELDRATEWQRRWRGKVAALAEWARGPYQEPFGATNLTIAVVAPQVDDLVAWTQDELSRRGLLELAELFLFTSASPTATDPVHWLCGTHWTCGTGEQVGLVTAPGPVEHVVHLAPR